jgi:hypoxanthine phosphoribosyltransferase
MTSRARNRQQWRVRYGWIETTGGDLGHIERPGYEAQRLMTAVPGPDLARHSIVRQRQLNLPWTLSRTTGEPQFAHPAEAELARILTFYRIRWLYEPTSFVLRNGDDGRPVESFTPDFFLPDHRQYIELTTMRQALVTRKNRKLRQVRELYPGVNIQLLYRRDVERLFRSYHDCWSEVDPAQNGKLIVDSNEVERRIGEIAAEIAATGNPSSGSSSGRPLSILNLAPGSTIFNDRLTTELHGRGVPIESSDISISRFRAASGKQNVKIVRLPDQPLSGRLVLLVADVVSSGLSLNYLVDWIRRQGAKDVQICAFFDRKTARLIDLPVRYAAFEAPDEPLIGYGIGACTEHRDLSFVAAIDEHVVHRR